CADPIRAADIDSFIIDLDADTVSAQDQFILCLNADRTKTEQDGTEDIQATLHKKTPPKRYFGKARSKLHAENITCGQRHTVLWPPAAMLRFASWMRSRPVRGCVLLR